MSQGSRAARSSQGSRAGHSPNGHPNASLSPAPCRPRHRDSGRQIIVEQVAKKSTAGIVYRVLTRTKYTEWTAVMCVNLQAAGLWEAVQYSNGEYRDDHHALAALLRAVLPEMQVGPANKESAHEAWEAIRRIRVGADRVKEANMERLRHDFTDIKFKPSESVEDFSIHINSIANELRVLGEEITDKEVVKKMLHSILEKLEQVAISMEMLLDLNTLSIEEATGHLHAIEQRKKSSSSSVTDDSGRLLLMEEEWIARMKAREKGGSSGSGGSGGDGGRDKGRGKNKGCGGWHSGGGANSNCQEGSEDGTGRGACHNCMKLGHWARNCRSRPKKTKAHIAQEEESSLLLSETSQIELVTLAPPTPATLSPLEVILPAQQWSWDPRVAPCPRFNLGQWERFTWWRKRSWCTSAMRRRSNVIGGSSIPAPPTI
jgi:uncharacterized membrane protein YgcG